MRLPVLSSVDHAKAEVVFGAANIAALRAAAGCAFDLQLGAGHNLDQSPAHYFMINTEFLATECEVSLE